jgi:hypothetical protein
MRIHYLRCGTDCPVGGALFDGFSKGLLGPIPCAAQLIRLRLRARIGRRLLLPPGTGFLPPPLHSRAAISSASDRDRPPGSVRKSGAPARAQARSRDHHLLLARREGARSHAARPPASRAGQTWGSVYDCRSARLGGGRRAPGSRLEAFAQLLELGRDGRNAIRVPLPLA